VHPAPHPGEPGGAGAGALARIVQEAN
jgi:hypothetical protein